MIGAPIGAGIGAPLSADTGVDTAECRRAVAAIGLFPFFGPGITPNASPDREWRQEVAHGYPCIPASGIASRSFTSTSVAAVSFVGTRVIGEAFSIAGAATANFVPEGAVVEEAAFSVVCSSTASFVPQRVDYTNTVYHLHKPVDAALAGKQLFRDRYREFVIRPQNEINATVASRGRPVRLGGGKPSFTTTTTSKGFD